MRFVEPTYSVPKFHKGITIAHQLKESEVLSLYIDYFNNFLTVEKFAEHHGYPLESAEYIINKGRELLNKNQKK